MDGAAAPAAAADGGGGEVLPIQYEPPPVVFALATSPRWGHSSDFTDLLASPEERTDYMVGHVFGGAVVVGCFLLWGLILVSMMFCRGRGDSDDRKSRRCGVGFLSGRPFRLTASDEAAFALAKTEIRRRPPSRRNLGQCEDYDENCNNVLLDEEEEQELLRSYSSNASCGNRPTRIRTLFLLAGAVFVTFSVLIVTEGLANLQSAIDVFEKSSDEVNLLAVDGLDLIENGFLRAGHMAEKVRTAIEREIDGGNFCPALPDLEDLADAQALRSEAQTAVDQLKQLGDFINQNVESIRGALLSARDGSARLSETLEPVELTDWKALLVLIPYSIIPALLMAGTVMAMFDTSFFCYSFFLNWIVCPIFVILVVVAWVCAGLMLYGAGINGDFCLPGGRLQDAISPASGVPATTINGGNPPDRTVLSLLESFDVADPTVNSVALFYISQCTNGNDPFEFVRQAQPQLAQGSQALAQAGQMFMDKTVVDSLSLVCNRDFGGFEVLIDNLDALMVLLLESVRKTLDLLACDRIVPLYTETVYSGMCTYSPEAVFWVFSSCLVMGVMGMIMLTTRAAYKRTFYTIPEQVVYGDAAPPRGRSARKILADDDDDDVERRSVEDVRLPGPSRGVPREDEDFSFDADFDNHDVDGRPVYSSPDGRDGADSLNWAVNDDEPTVNFEGTPGSGQPVYHESRSLPRQQSGRGYPDRSSEPPYPPRGYDGDGELFSSPTPADRINMLMR